MAEWETGRKENKVIGLLIGHRTLPEWESCLAGRVQTGHSMWKGGQARRDNSYFVKGIDTLPNTILHILEGLSAATSPLFMPGTRAAHLGTGKEPIPHGFAAAADEVTGNTEP